jgi:hypothetical protein
MTPRCRWDASARFAILSQSGGAGIGASVWPAGAVPGSARHSEHYELETPTKSKSTNR